MKKKLILTILVGLVIGSGSVHHARAQSYDKRDAAVGARQRFDKLIANAFAVKYKTRGRTMIASAVGNKLHYLRSKKVKLDDGSVMVRAITKDGALEITTYFALDEQKQQLVIDRRIRNKSGKPVRVQMIDEYVDPKLIFGDKSHAANSDLMHAALKRIRAGQIVQTAPALRDFPDRLTAESWEICHCPPPPPPCGVVICPDEPNYIRARWTTLSSHKIVLQWQQPTVLASQNTRSALSRPSEMRIVIDVDLR